MFTELPKRENRDGRWADDISNCFKNVYMNMIGQLVPNTYFNICKISIF